MIYLLSNSPRESAASLCDTHLNESILDAGMAISYYLWMNRRESTAFDAAVFFQGENKNHKSDITRVLYPLRGRKDLYDWVILRPRNYTFLVQYLTELLQEYLYRFASPHKLSSMIDTLPKKDFVAFHLGDGIGFRVKACIDLYKQPKSSWKWTNRDMPSYDI